MTTDTTVWSTTLTPGTGPAATLHVAVNGGAPAQLALKGICYSPQPINGSSSMSPSLGDLFWDSFSGDGYAIDGWSALWARDLPNIRALGANTIRVYNMMSRQLTGDGQWPASWNSGHLFTHRSFLDACWNNNVDPLYVMVGIALPQQMFWKMQYEPHSPLTDFWTNVLRETAAELGNHPAVLGFIIANEVDAANVTYCSNTGPSADCQADAKFWWSQANAMAAVVKGSAPGKLVGIANHDDSFICGQAGALMANCPSIDFWGVNTYQPQSFESVFQGAGSPGDRRPGYDGLKGSALKPVIITEYGFPVSARPNACDPSGICVSADSIQNVASVLGTMLPKAYSEPLSLGLYYFEYCDELWNQSAYAIPSCRQADFVPPNIFTPFGGPPAAGLPNGYWDQDSFGLYATARGGTLPNNAPIWNSSGYPQGPVLPIDTLTPRAATVAAVKAAYRGRNTAAAPEPICVQPAPCRASAQTR
jgi:hypothetical protein